MDLFFHNIEWMALNLYLAFLPVFFSLFLFKVPSRIIKYTAGLLWFIYLPNSVYVITDLQHLMRQSAMVDAFEKITLFFEYLLFEIIGLIFFLVAFYPLEVILSNLRINGRNRVFVLVLINFFLGFLMSLGEFERVNSWDVFTNPLLVISSTLDLLSSFKLVAFGVSFGLFANFFYFLFREKAGKIYTIINSKFEGRGN